jgi:hypothetical protein
MSNFTFDLDKPFKSFEQYPKQLEEYSGTDEWIGKHMKMDKCIELVE